MSRGAAQVKLSCFSPRKQEISCWPAPHLSLSLIHTFTSHGSGSLQGDVQAGVDYADRESAAARLEQEGREEVPALGQ